MIARIRRWRKRRAVRVECEVCGKRIRPKDAITVTDEGYGSTEFGAGGWSMSATYCKTDAPQEATT